MPLSTIRLLNAEQRRVPRRLIPIEFARRIVAWQTVACSASRRVIPVRLSVMIRFSARTSRDFSTTRPATSPCRRTRRIVMSRPPMSLRAVSPAPRIVRSEIVALRPSRTRAPRHALSRRGWSSRTPPLSGSRRGAGFRSPAYGVPAGISIVDPGPAWRIRSASSSAAVATEASTGKLRVATARTGESLSSSSLLGMLSDRRKGGGQVPSAAKRHKVLKIHLRLRIRACSVPAGRDPGECRKLRTACGNLPDRP